MIKKAYAAVAADKLLRYTEHTPARTGRGIRILLRGFFNGNVKNVGGKNRRRDE